jgi:hypothetical protein
MFEFFPSDGINGNIMHDQIRLKLQPWRLIFVSQLIHMVEISVGLIWVFKMRISQFLLPVGYGCTQ